MYITGFQPFGLEIFYCQTLPCHDVLKKGHECVETLKTMIVSFEQSSVFQGENTMNLEKSIKYKLLA